MKKLLLGLTALLMVHMAEAQLFTLGLKAGVSSSRTQVEESFTVEGTQVTYNTGDATLGWHIGLFGRIKITKLYVQPEVLFSSTGGEIEVTQGNVTTPEIMDVDYNKLDVPVMVGFFVIKPLRIFVGPTFSYLISEDVEGPASLVSNVEQNYNSATVGYQAGIGLDISNLTVDLKYEGNLSKLGNSVTLPGTDEEFSTDLRNPQFILSVGYAF